MPFWCSDSHSLGTCSGRPPDRPPDRSADTPRRLAVEDAEGERRGEGHGIPGDAEVLLRLQHRVERGGQGPARQIPGMHLIACARAAPERRIAWACTIS